MVRRQSLRQSRAASQSPAPLSYAWYYSTDRMRDRQQPAASPSVPSPQAQQSRPQQARHPLRTLALLSAIFVVFALIFYSSKIDSHFTQPKSTQQTTTASTTGSAQTITPSACAANTLSKLVYVSISKRHLWACAGTVPVYNSPVVTGMDMYAADITPTGTFHVYAKETNVHLTGSDGTGSWDDYVHYWMPWLNNRYGQYGFHDATWRSDSVFGNISPNSHSASHGCVETPLATAKWLYGWVQVGTTVKVVS